MKSIRKRFRMVLAEVEKVADELLIMAVDVRILEPVQELASSVLQACSVLGQRIEQLNKVEFVQQIMGEEALFRLDEVVDTDVMSVLEEQFSVALGDVSEIQLIELLQQLLEKVEKKLLVMNEGIQQLGGLLNEAE